MYKFITAVPYLEGGKHSTLLNASKYARCVNLRPWGKLPSARCLGGLVTIALQFFHILEVSLYTKIPLLKRWETNRFFSLTFTLYRPARNFGFDRVSPVWVLCMYVCMSVCIYVCPEAPSHSFLARNLKLGTRHPCRLWKNYVFVFSNFNFLRAFLPPFTPKNVEKWPKKP